MSVYIDHTAPDLMSHFWSDRKGYCESDVVMQSAPGRVLRIILKWGKPNRALKDYPLVKPMPPRGANRK